VTLLAVYGALKKAGGAFVRERNGDISILLPEDVTLPADLDAEVISKQRDLAELAAVVDLKEPREWNLDAALRETAERFQSTMARFLDAPEDMRARIDHRVRPLVDKGRALVDRAFQRRDMIALRLALVAVEADVMAVIVKVEREGRGN
jgi:hypothetical protein